MNQNDLILPELPPGYRYRKEGEFELQSQRANHKGDIDIFLDIPVTEETEYGDVIKAWVTVLDNEVYIRNTNTKMPNYLERFDNMQEALNMLVLRLCLNEY